jgi:1-deoxy-D-xylulose-5-phosphate synthase
MRFVKPIDEDMLHDVFSRFSAVITVEDGCIQGGFGSAVIEFMADHGYTAKIKRLGIPDKWIEHGEQPQLWKECGFDTDAIVKTAVELVSKRKPVTA